MTTSRNLQKSALLLFLLGFFSKSQSLPVFQFYSFGSSFNDRKLHKNDDESSPRMIIAQPFPFFDQFHDGLYVNTNGVVSFLELVSQYTPDAFPLGGNRRLLTPFWADVDIRNGGDVWYRETMDKNILNKATSDVRRAFVRHMRFVATWAYIVTWDQVAHYAGNIPRPVAQRNTFQAVLISDGRHSFVIYNYDTIVWTTGTASGGNSMGHGGTPAQCGFNAGDGIRYFSIPGSRTSRILNLPKTSNVGIPGVWMFRIDNSDIEAGGCNVNGSLTVSPSFGSMLGGENILLAGPCLQPNDRIICEFDGKEKTKGTYINAIRAFCAVPMATKTGRVPLRVSIDNGATFGFKGNFTYVSLTQVVPQVIRINPDNWLEGVAVDITWNSTVLGNSSQEISIQISRFLMQKDTISFHGHYTVINNRLNDGRGRITVPVGEGEGPAYSRFITLVRIVKKPLSKIYTPAEWIWSDLFLWLNIKKSRTRCKNWAVNEQSPKIYTEDPTFLSCPRNLVQAMADQGRYTEDEFCNTKNEDGCTRYHKGAKQCIRTITPSDKGAGQQCCYNQQGNLILKIGSAGSLDRFHIDKGIPYISHFFHDIVPYLDCCFKSSEESCRIYYTKRPSDNGQKYIPPRPTTGYGDPHMVTLDGVEYTFNGRGEFKILNVLTSGFTLQGRMEPLQAGNKGTVYTAFATKESRSDTVQIQLNGRKMVDVLLNGEILELEEGRIMEFRSVSIMKYSTDSKYSVIFNSGISVTIKGTPDLLQVILLVPQSFKGKTSGLLGYWNDNKANEFRLPDGRFIPTSSSPHVIHYNFALKWATKAHESLFKYQAGKSHSSYSDPYYRPAFIDKNNINFGDSNLERQARAACGTNVQCLFDISTTGKVNVGVASRQTYTEFSSIVDRTTKEACVAIYPNIPGGVVQRVDSSDGRMTYRVTCNEGYEIQGSSSTSCKDGKWSAALPKCISKNSAGPWNLKTYIIIGAAVAFVIIIIIVIFCCYKICIAHTSNRNANNRVVAPYSNAGMAPNSINLSSVAQSQYASASSNLQLRF